VEVAVADAKLCASFLSIDQLHHEWHEKKYRCSTPSVQLLKKYLFAVVISSICVMLQALLYLHKGSTSQTFHNFNFVFVSTYLGIPNVVLLIGVNERAHKEEGTLLMRINVRRS
jgi:hypothetical protein